MTRKNPFRFSSVWLAHFTLVVAIILQVTLNDRLVLGPRYLLAALELAALFGLSLTVMSQHQNRQHLRRLLSLTLIGLITFANIASLVLVCRYLVNGNHINGHTLIISALGIYVTNIIMFGLWYWELDTPGLSGIYNDAQCDDFLFPQQASLKQEMPHWQPGFFDYLYVSVTNASAFSPTDAMPLTHRVKLLMMIQSLASFITIALVAARGVNILG